MFSKSNEPGAPVLPSGRVVGSPGPKQGHVDVPLSIGCLTLTPIGATYCALCINEARAVAFDPTPTELTPKSFVKTPCAERRTCTLIVSFAAYGLDEMVTVVVPPPFLVAYCWARLRALLVSYGRACAPARAAASAVDWVARPARYPEPMSRTSAAMPSSTTRNTTVMTVAWPLSLRIFIPHAPWSCSTGGPTSRPGRGNRHVQVALLEVLGRGPDLRGHSRHGI